jgi:hypothetical protein
MVNLSRQTEELPELHSPLRDVHGLSWEHQTCFMLVSIDNAGAQKTNVCDKEKKQSEKGEHKFSSKNANSSADICGKNSGKIEKAHFR